jgi:hypothetical protein
MVAYKKEILGLEATKEKITQDLAKEALQLINLSWNKYNETLLALNY